MMAIKTVAADPSNLGSFSTDAKANDDGWIKVGRRKHKVTAPKLDPELMTTAEKLDLLKYMEEINKMNSNVEYDKDYAEEYRKRIQG